MPQAGSAPSQTGPITVKGLLHRAGGSLLLNAVCPWLAYQLLIARGASVVVALAVAAVFPLAGTLIGWVRLGRPDVLGILSALFVAVSLAVALETEDASVILLRPALTSAIFAVLCFGSLTLGRPLMFYVARQYVAGWDRAAFARFGGRWEQPGFRRAMRRLTVAWGCWFAVQALGRITAVALLDVPTLLAAWPFITNVGTVAMILWSANGSRRDPDERPRDTIGQVAGLSVAARQALDDATQEARRLRHAYVGAEHLLVGLCDDAGVAAVALRQVGVTRATARATLEALVGSGNAPAWRQGAHDDQLRATIGRATVAQAAEAAAEIGTDQLLSGLLDDPDCQAAQILVYMGVDLADLRAGLASAPDRPIHTVRELPPVAVDGGS